jgi:hypothetical protein
VTRPALARLYRLWSDRGPCGICGVYQGCRQEWDEIAQRLRRADRYAVVGVMATLRREYRRTLAQIVAVGAAYAEARRLHAPLPGREPR